MNADKQESSAVNWGWLFILCALVIIAGLSTYFLLPSLVEPNDDSVTIIQSLDQPIKVKPDEAGGKIIGHQDLLVVDILKNNKNDSDQTENLISEEVNPEPPPLEANKDEIRSNVLSEGIKKVDIPDRTTPEEMIVSKNKETKSSVPKSVKKEQGKFIAEAPSKKPNPKPKKENQRPKLNQNYSDIKDPLYLIQLAAFRRSDKANEIAKLLSEKHKSRLGQMKLETMEISTSNNGIFYRIVSTPMSRSSAENLCLALRRAGQDCFLRKLPQLDS